MRGSTIGRLLAAAFFLTLAGIPVWNLTRPRVAHVPEAQPAVAKTARSVSILLSTLPPASSLEVNSLGESLLSVSAATASTDLELPTETASEIVLSAKWPEATTGARALRITATQGDDEILDTTLWSEGELNDVVTLPLPTP